MAQGRGAWAHRRRRHRRLFCPHIQVVVAVVPALVASAPLLLLVPPLFSVPARSQPAVEAAAAGFPQAAGAVQLAQAALRVPPVAVAVRPAAGLAPAQLAVLRWVPAAGQHSAPAAGQRSAPAAGRHSAPAVLPPPLLLQARLRAQPPHSSGRGAASSSSRRPPPPPSSSPAVPPPPPPHPCRRIGCSSQPAWPLRSRSCRASGRRQACRPRAAMSSPSPQSSVHIAAEQQRPPLVSAERRRAHQQDGLGPGLGVPHAACRGVGAKGKARALGRQAGSPRTPPS